MAVFRAVGDVHGKMNQYLDIIQGCDQSIQVGDFGAGFVDLPEIDTVHRQLRGNHDAPSVMKTYPNWIPDGHSENGMFFVGGARSEDQHLRREGVSWWADEELSMSEFYDALDKYEQAKPDFLFTHDCPEYITHILLGYVNIRPSRTQQFLESMRHIHKPKIHVFGHWHKSFDEVIDGTRYICLAELEYIDLDI